MRWAGRLLPALLITVWLSPPGHAQRFPADPVDALRDALKQDLESKGTEEAQKAARDAAREYRQKTLDARQKAIRTLGDLARALLLQEWGYEARNLEEIALIDREVFATLAKRFEEGAKAALEQGEPAVRRATAALLAETAVTARGSGSRTAPVQDLIHRLAPSLAVATRSPDAGVRASAAIALGQVSPDPAVAVDALDRILSGDSTGPRRAAAEALLNLVLVGYEGERRGRSEKPLEVVRKDLAETGSRVVVASGKVLARPDPDPVVRRLVAEAMQATAFGLSEAVVTPITLSFPPESRTPWSEEELLRAKDYASEVDAELTQLGPLLEALIAHVRPLARTLTDRDTTVRLAAARALEDVAAAREKLRQRRASVPKPPESKPAPDPKDKANGNDKEARRAADGGVRLVAHQERQGKEERPQPTEPRAQAALRVVIKDLAAALRDPDVRVRLAAVDALELFGEEGVPAAKELAESLRDCDHFVRWAAARTLGRIAPVATATAVPGLIAMLRDPDLDVRLAAANALAAYGPDGAAAVPELTRSVGRGDAEIRVAASQALKSIGLASASAIPEVIKALGHPDARVRRAAAELLGQFGTADPKDKGAAAAIAAARGGEPQLRRLLDDPDPEVRRAASDALLRLLPVPTR